MTDLPIGVATESTTTPVWSVVCIGLSANCIQAVQIFCQSNVNFRLVDSLSLATSLLPDTAPEPTLLLYSSRWLELVGARGLRNAQDTMPGCRVIIFGPLPASQQVHELLRFGLCGVLAGEPESAESLGRVLLAVTDGQFWFSRAELAQVVRQLEAARRTTSSETSPDLPGLTPRENAVLRQIQLGLTNKDIARSLAIAEHTVKIHVQHIYQKLRLHRRTDLLLLRWKREETDASG